MKPCTYSAAGMKNSAGFRALRSQLEGSGLCPGLAASSVHSSALCHPDLRKHPIAMLCALRKHPNATQAVIRERCPPCSLVKFGATSAMVRAGPRAATASPVLHGPHIPAVGWRG